VEGTAEAVGPFAGELVVEDAAAGGHPLGVAFGDHAAAAVGVVVGDLTVEDVADGFDAAVGMPWRALRLAGGVDQRADVVEQQERVGIGESQVAGEGSGDDEAAALGRVSGRDDPGHRPGRGGRVGPGDAGQDKGVFDGDGRHGDQLLSSRTLTSCRVVAPLTRRPR
jgi:hypothetical protein